MCPQGHEGTRMQQPTLEYPKDLGLHLGGEWVTCGRDERPVLNPATGQTLGNLPLASDADLDHAIACSELGFRQWRSTAPAARAATLSKAARLLNERTEALATAATLEQGKPMAESRAEANYVASPTRFYVQENVYDRFLEAFLAKTETVRLGSGVDEMTTMGPVANSRRIDAMEMLVADARNVGARVAVGGERDESARGLFYRPTVLAHVPIAARAMNEEPFGPMALINSFRTVEEAVEQANRLPYGLAAFAFTENGRRQLFLQENVECGLLGINTLALSAVDAPFGGVKESGHGSEDGPEGLEAFLVTKTVHQG